MVDAFANALLLPISETRLRSYGEESDPVETKLLIYFWNLELSQAYYPLFQAFEVAFRSTIHETIRSHKQNERWFEDSDFLHQGQIEKVNEAKESLKERGKPDTTWRVVTQLTFGFWTSLLNRPYEESLWHTGSPILLLTAFPHLPKY